MIYTHEHNNATNQIHSIAQQQCHKTEFEQIHKDNSEDNETSIELNLQREDITQPIKMYKGQNIKRTIFIRKIIGNNHR
jgi:hypothetical protein